MKMFFNRVFIVVKFKENKMVLKLIKLKRKLAF